MYIIADARLPAEVLTNLQSHGRLLVLSTQHITYDAISGHPDIFFCRTPDKLIAAPNAPGELLGILKDAVDIHIGEKPVGSLYPDSATYNAFVNQSYIIHNLTYTDAVILHQCAAWRPLYVGQAYTRCNLVEVADLYITSDKGIEKVLRKERLDVFFIDPKSIILPGQAHGFFGGCAGTNDRMFFLAGCCDHFPEGHALKAELKQRGVELIELYDGPLVDGGSILFI